MISEHRSNLTSQRADILLIALIGPILLTLWVAAATKIIFLKDFWAVLENVPLLPDPLLVPLSGVIVVLEIFLPIGALIWTTRKASAAALVLLFSLFLAFSLYRIASGMPGSCGCFHGILNLTSVQDAILDGWLLVSSTLLFFLSRPTEKINMTTHVLSKFSKIGPEAGFCGVAVVAALALSGWQFMARHEKAKPVPGVRAAALLNGVTEFQGSAQSENTIVMFMDYQCEPCKEVHLKVEEALRKNPGKLRVTYRNFPILQLHPFAIDAALAVEAAKRQGKYWEAHHALFEADLNRTTIDKLLKPLKLDPIQYKKDTNGAAQEALRQDQQLASQLGVDSTPTMFLCRANGDVIRLRNSEDISSQL